MILAVDHPLPTFCRQFDRPNQKVKDVYASPVGNSITPGRPRVVLTAPLFEMQRGSREAVFHALVVQWIGYKIPNLVRAVRLCSRVLKNLVDIWRRKAAWHCPGSGPSREIETGPALPIQASRGDARGRSSTLTPLPPLVEYTATRVPTRLRYNMAGCPGNRVSYGADGFPLSGCVSGTFSGLAQLVEHIIRNDGVRRSSRRAGANILLGVLGFDWASDCEYLTRSWSVAS